MRFSLNLIQGNERTTWSHSSPSQDENWCLRRFRPLKSSEWRRISVLCFSRVRRISPDLLALSKSALVIDSSMSLIKKKQRLRSHIDDFNNLYPNLTGRWKLTNIEGSGSEIGEPLEHSYGIVENRLWLFWVRFVYPSCFRWRCPWE